MNINKTSIVVGTLLALIFCFNVGCSTQQKGGTADVTYTETTTSLDANDKPVTTTKTVEVASVQPDSPQAPAKVDVIMPPGGGTNITASSGSGQNNAGIMAAAGNAKIITYAGLGMTIFGILVCGLLLKNWVWAGIVSGTGVAITVLSYLLVQYAMFFLFGFVILVAYGAYLGWDYLRQRRAAAENVEIIQKGKEKGIIDPVKFNDLADVVQSSSTKAVVKSVKKKIKDSK